MEIGEEYNPDLYTFEWNQQKVTVSCICGESLDVMSDGSATCACGRIYWLETKLKVDWDLDTGGDESQLLEAGYGRISDDIYQN